MNVPSEGLLVAVNFNDEHLYIDLFKISKELSREKSLIHIILIYDSVCNQTLSRHFSKYFSVLYTGIITETFCTDYSSDFFSRSIVSSLVYPIESFSGVQPVSSLTS